MPLFSNDRAIKEFKAWASDHAIRLDRPLQSDSNLARLAALDTAIANKRIVYLGEPDHFIHEKYDYRLLMLRYLISRGWNHIGEEMGIVDGYRIDRFLATGDSSHLDRAPIYGYKGGQRIDRDDSATGLLKDSFTAFPLAEFAAEQKSFAQKLRGIATAPPDPAREISFFGFDIDALPGAGYEDLAEILAPAADNDSVRRIIATLARVPGESLADEIARLDIAIQLIDAEPATMSRLIGSAHAATVARFARALRDSFHYTQSAYPASDWRSLNVAMALREETMHRNVARFAETGPETKTVLMSHNLHLAKDFDRIKGNFGAGPGGGRVTAIGTFVHRMIVGQVYSVWMLCNRGRDRQPFSFCTCEIKPVAGSLNSILSEIGSAFILPLSTDSPIPGLLDSKMLIQMDGQPGVRAAIADQADAIFFVDEVSPLRASPSLEGRA
jgi:erythromycin esterase-like protein